MNKHVLIFFLLIFSTFVMANKDQAYQDRIHQIYLKYYKSPVTYSEWSEAIKSLKPSYKLKHKDNLWDISGSFFNKHLYWSKLWVANSSVQNPHRIYKGDSIKFDLKTLTAVNKSKHSVDLQEQFPGISIPLSPYSKTSLSSGEIPSSLPEFRLEELVRSVVEVNFNIVDVDIKREALLPFYISESSASSVGKIIGKEGYGSDAINGENVIVMLDSQVSIGSYYTVLQSRKISNFLYSFMSGNEYENIISGEIKILAYVSGKEFLYLAEVTKSIHPISKGDLMIAGSAPTYTLSQKGSYGTGAGKIIGSPEGSNFLSLYSVVYLNKGAASSIQKGDMYYVRASKSKKYSERPTLYNKAVVGQLRIIHVSSDRATAVITQSINQIHVGDYFSEFKDISLNLDDSKSHELVSPEPEFIDESDLDQEVNIKGFEIISEDREKDKDINLEQETEDEDSFQNNSETILEDSESIPEGAELILEDEEGDTSQEDKESNIDVIRDEFQSLEELDSELDE